MTDNSSKANPVETWRHRVLKDATREGQPLVRDSRLVQGLPAPPAIATGQTEQETPKKEWESSLLLVQEACDSIRSSEERVEALQLELELAAAERREEQKEFAARLQTAHDESKLANIKMREAEARALEAEGWLTRLNEAIVSGFGGTISRNARDSRN